MAGNSYSHKDVEEVEQGAGPEHDEAPEEHGVVRDGIPLRDRQEGQGLAMRRLPSPAGARQRAPFGGKGGPTYDNVVVDPGVPAARTSVAGHRLSQGPVDAAHEEAAAEDRLHDLAGDGFSAAGMPTQESSTSVRRR